MRTLNRNKVRCYYANPLRSELKTVNNVRTSERVMVYDEVKPICLAFTQVSGYATPTNYGADEGYTFTIVADKGCPIIDGAKIWRGIDPMCDDDGNPTAKHNFIVKRKFPSLNGVLYGVKEVDVS